MTDKNTNINVIIAAILSLLFVLFSFTGISFFEKMDAGLYDLGSGFAHNDNLDPDKVALIEIDDKSVDNLGTWPWPRRIIAEMIDTLKKNGAQLIGLNIPFAEMEHNEGLEEIKKFREKYDAYPATDGNISLKKWVLENLDQIEEKIDNDSSLINSIKNAGNVILPVYSSHQKNTTKDKATDESFLLKNALNASNISFSLKTRVSTDSLLFPIPEISNNAAGVGQVITSAMADITDRSYPAFISYKGTLLPSFPLVVAASYFGLATESLIIKDNMILLKEHTVPLTKGEVFIKFSKTMKRYSFADVLNNKNLKEDLKGKIILIGLNDYKSRTLDMPGVVSETQLNAQLLDNMINSGTISRPSIMPYLEIILILVIGIAVTFFFPIKGRIGSTVLVSGIFLLILSTELILLIAMGIWLKTAYIAGCLVSVYLALVLKDLFISEVFRKESPEEARLLGINYQGKGLLDQAFKKFQRLPHDNGSKELIYSLGLEYENKNRIDKALEVYEYIAGIGGYQDIEERIARLKKSEKSSVTGSLQTFDGAGKASDSGDRGRTWIGRYEILGILGKGSMGLVYKAQDPKINRLVAIKTMRFSDEFEEDLIHEIKERFFREAEIAGQLSHPSIVTIHDVGDDGDLTYMAMEFLEGEDLDKFISKGNLLSFRRVLDVIFKIAEALDFAHKASVIHRDIKPANVMLLKNGNVKVTDFGIAKAISSSRTKTGVILGTPNYMSPEQIMGQKIDPRSDIFSLGVLFYQLITGELPFHGDNLSGLLYQITQIKHPSPRSHNPKIPGICEQILDKAMAKDPNKRFRSAGEMARVINALGQRIDQIRIEKSSIK
jgi:eukaryotic-like serine/threonine-protein kinase